MKIYKYIYISVFLLIFVLDSYSQIGVNTENPRHLFHLDGASSVATTNPNTGVVSTTQATDDVIMTVTGSLGIGTNAVGAGVKLKIGEGQTFRLVDGTQGIRRALVSDNNGNASWRNVSGTWFAGLTGADYTYSYPLQVGQPVEQVFFTNYSSSIISSPTEGAVDNVAGVMTLPYSGYYKLTITLWMGNHVPNPAGVMNLYTSILNIVQTSGAVCFSPHTISPRNTYGQIPTYSTMVYLTANETLRMRISGSPNNTTMANGATLFAELILAD